MSQLRDDCFAQPGPRLPVAEALARLEAAAVPVVGVEDVTLESARGRVLAADLVSPRDVPAFTNVAVDGWAVRHADLDPERPTRLVVAEGRAAAGHPWPGRLPPGAALRVLTGGALPEGADSVLMQEDVRVDGDGIRVPAGLKLGANRRKAGEDMCAGQVVLAAGTRLRPQELAAAAATGHATLRVFRPLRVAVVSTGDELREPGPDLPRGAVFDANRVMLKALLASLPAAVTDLGIVPDDAPTVRAALRDAATSHDVLLTSGGASRGEEDHMVDAVRALGRLDFWQIAMKPGRPLAFGRLGDAVFTGLPGNPVAAFVCFLRFARPLLLALAGAPFPTPRAYPLPAAFAQSKKPDRTELLRARVVDGPAVERIAREGSGIITALTDADGLVELGPKVTEVRPDEPVDYLPFAEFGLSPT